MIVAYLLVTLHWTVTLADMESCERVKAARQRLGSSGECVQVLVPTPSREAFFNLPSKIGK